MIVAAILGLVVAGSIPGGEAMARRPLPATSPIPERLDRRLRWSDPR